MANNASNSALVLASLILGASIFGGGLIVGNALDRSSEQLKEVLVALAEAKPEAPAPTPAARPGRPDPARRYEVEVGSSPVRGPKQAAISIVEFSDFQCPFCARVGPTLKKIEEEYGDKVQLVFKHLPLSIHPKAPAAHAAAEAAHAQGKFWEMHDLIFANQREMSAEKYEEFAQQIGLDVERFKKDVASAAVKKRVDADAAKAASLGISGTPAFLVNGRYLSGAQPFASFKRVIDEELRDKG